MILLPNDGTQRRKPRRMRPVKPSPAARRRYTEALNLQADLLRAATASLADIVRADGSRSAVVERLTGLMASTQATIDRVAPAIAGTFVTDVDVENKRRTEANVAQALGVDFATILSDSPTLKATVDLATANNARLIKSIGSEHWGLVGQAVLDNYVGKALPDNASLLGRLQDLGGITKRRASFIARDQTNKLSGAINQDRQTHIGIDEYKWRNAQDQRVVGNPSGRYPHGNAVHGDHWDREGEVYSWDNPPEDGIPGHPPGCRCYAEPIIDPAKLKALYV